MKSKLAALALGLAALSAQAAPTFAFKNVPAGWNGAFSIKLAGFESFSGNPFTAGTQNFGVLKITSIQTIGFGTTTIWSDGDNGAEITGVFGGITTDASSGGLSLRSTGGSANFYINSFGSYSAAGGAAQGLAGYAAAGGGCAVNSLCYNGISNVGGGGLLLSAAYVPGIDSAFPAVTVAGSLATTNPLSGVASGYLNVTGGSEMDRFNTNSLLGGLADLLAKNSFCTVDNGVCALFSDAGGSGPNGWQLAIDDPVKGFVKLPEPASMALVGAALLGLGLVRRRKSV